MKLTSSRIQFSMEVILVSYPFIQAKHYSRGRNESIKYIVIHYTGNKGDTAKANANYFSTASRAASAHLVVDPNTVYQCVKYSDTAYHCGGGLQGSGGHSFYKKCTNSNSIGIEMCLLDRNGNIRDNTIIRTIEIVKELMKTYNIPVSNVIRHWDVTGKDCPAPMKGNNNVYWNNFKSKLIEEEVDMSELNDLRNEFRQYQQNIQQTLNTLTQQIQELSCSVGTVANNQDRVYRSLNEIPDWGKSTVNKLVDNGTLVTQDFTMNYSLLRTLVILDRNGSFDKETVYSELKDVPSWGRDTVSKLTDCGILKGDGTGLGLSNTMLRILVILDRAGSFDIKTKRK